MATTKTFPDTTKYPATTDYPGTVRDSDTLALAITESAVVVAQSFVESWGFMRI